MDVKKSSSGLKSKTYHVKHILFTHKYEAEDVIRKLRGLKASGLLSQFEKFAQKVSQCPSAIKGGDLGIVTWKKADPNFEEAVALLKPGDYTREPVRTRFGYHIIFRLQD